MESSTSDGGARDWRLTLTFPDASGFAVNLDATRRKPGNGGEPSGHGLRLQIMIRL